METLTVAGVLGPEGRKRVLEPEAREDGGSTVAGADDVEHLLLGLADQPVEVRVDERESGAGTPVTEETVLDVVGGDVALDEGVVLEEDHGCLGRVRTRRDGRRKIGDAPAAM